MKRSEPHSPSPGASEKKIKFSRSEVESLIKMEVLNAVTHNSIKLQGLVDVIQQLDHEVDYESIIQKLEARVQNVTKRAEAALACMTNNKESFFPVVEAISTVSEDETPVAVSQMDTKSENCKTKKIIEIMESTKKALNRMHADNEAMRATIADLSEDLLLPAHSLHGSSRSEDIQDVPQLINKEEDLENDKMDMCKEPKADRLRVESNLRHTNAEQDGPLYPPLPRTSLPANVNPEAALYNMPSKLKVQLALIRQPAGLSALWTAVGQQPSPPPMESYSIFMTMEKVKGCGVFPDWRTLGKVKAIPLPMCVLINKYKPGHKVCVAVVGKDIFGRYGPYSEVVSAVIPE